MMFPITLYSLPFIQDFKWQLLESLEFLKAIVKFLQLHNQH